MVGGRRAPLHVAAAAYILLIASFCCCAAYLVAGRNNREVVLENKCKETVWVASQGSPDGALGLGGWTVAPGKKVAVTVEEGWHGRFWGRTGCRFNRATGRGKCETGDCAGLALCAGVGGSPPTTLAEFSFASPTDFYDVSLVDGFNLPVTITPVPHVRMATSSCRPASCSADLNPICPSPLRVLRARSRDVVACRSACNAFGQAQFCCTGPFASPASCRPSSFSRIFKRACPHAYTYAFDDPTSTFTCSSPRSYLITFCQRSVGHHRNRPFHCCGAQTRIVILPWPL